MSELSGTRVEGPRPNRPPERGITIREVRIDWINRYWLGVPLLVAFTGIVVGSGPLLGLSVLLLLAGLTARFWSRHALDNIRYERSIPESHAFAGDTVTVNLSLVNDKLLPVPWLEVRDAFPEGLIGNESRISPAPVPHYVYLARSTQLGWFERVNWQLQIDAPARGFYRLGPARLESGDLFGFFPVTRDEEVFDSIIVYPKLYSMTELGLPAQRPFGERKGRERIFEDPSRIAGARDYAPGDPMKRIDWRASARVQNLQSKVYEPSSSEHILIAVNVHTLEHSWQGFLPEILERVLSTAASVARHALEQGYSVGLTANGAYPTSDRPVRVPAGRSSDQLVKILEALAVIGPLTLVSLQGILDKEAQAFPYGATLVCVTSRMEPSLGASLQKIAEAGHAVSVLSLADEDCGEDLGSLPVHNLSTVMRSLEARASETGIKEAP